MKLSFLSFFLLASLFSCCFSSFLEPKRVEERFEEWVLEEWKAYNQRGLLDLNCTLLPKEHYCLERLAVFTENLKRVQEFNLEGHSFTIGVNAFSHLTFEEFKATISPDQTKPLEGQSQYVPPIWNFSAPSNIPSSWDWRNFGAVTEVKNQGLCGGCYSFATTGALEALNFLVTRNLLSFSEQQIIDCSEFPYGNTGCNGGNYFSSFAYAVDNGILTEEQYPFLGENEFFCNQSDFPTGFKPKAYYSVLPNSPSQLLLATLAGPVAVAMNDNDPVFFQYTGGIYDGSCQDKYPTHSVLVVGFGTQDGTDYWLVKNSWGKDWGIEGYFKLKRTMEDGPCKCAICTKPAFPSMETLDKSASF